MTIRLDLVMIDDDTIDEEMERQRIRCRVYYVCYLALIGAVVLAALDDHHGVDCAVAISAVLLRPLLMWILTRHDER